MTSGCRGIGITKSEFVYLLRIMTIYKIFFDLPSCKLKDENLQNAEKTNWIFTWNSDLCIFATQYRRPYIIHKRGRGYLHTPLTDSGGWGNAPPWDFEANSFPIWSNNVPNLINHMCPFFNLYKGIMILNTKTKNLVYQIIDKKKCV